jgi:hypothetical protein
MPDTAGTITDHDIRLVAKVQDSTPTIPPPFMGMFWWDTSSTLESNLAVIKQTEIDFGPIPIDSTNMLISDAGITTSSFIIGSIAYVAPTGKSLDELEFDAFDLRFAPGTGQCTLHITSLQGLVADKFKINYIYC